MRTLFLTGFLIIKNSRKLEENLGKLEFLWKNSKGMMVFSGNFGKLKFLKEIE